ncbi:hypothetical protein L596_029095 [Steinernema carpocapsae]|uniref:Uncharacterized protein n=1 Tax=Steinernema carpocapsae TaxID=34508 RepID=A0A4U5LTM3_STECR|nr:hypothetical protein L596_029095 [Steinernema carpocapsae]
MSSFTLVLVGLVVWAISVFLWNRYKIMKKRAELGLTGPPADLLTGNIKDILIYSRKNGIASLPLLRFDWAKKYGETFGSKSRPRTWKLCAKCASNSSPSSPTVR